MTTKEMGTIGEGVISGDAVFSVTNEMETVDCVAERCHCVAVHRRFTGRRFIEFQAGGRTFKGELKSGAWE